jgi:hypothetical protein
MQLPANGEILHSSWDFLVRYPSPLDLLGTTSPPSLNFFAFAHPPV